MGRETKLARHFGHPLKIALREHDCEERRKRILPSWVSLFDYASKVALKNADGLRHDLPHLAVDRSIAPVSAVSDAQAAHAAMQTIHPVKTGSRQAVTVAHVGPGRRRHHQGRGGGGAGKRPDMLDRLPSRDAGITLVTPA